MGKGILGATVGGLIGAMVWSAIAYFTGYGIGFIAWGIGALAGAGMASQAGKGRAPTAGILAALVAFAAVLVGRFGASYCYLSDLGAEVTAATPEETAMNMLQGVVYDELVAEDVELSESEFDEYPPEVVAEAEARWEAMSEDERAQMLEAGAFMEDGAGVAAVIGAVVFTLISSVFPMNILWMILAVSTAYKVGNNGGRPGEADATTGATDPVEVREAPSLGHFGRVPPPEESRPEPNIPGFKPLDAPIQGDDAQRAAA